MIAGRIVMSTPALSIVIPAHNEAHRLRETILAVERTTDIPYEAIVVDDASTDGCAAFLDHEPHPHVRLIRNESALGVAGARNRGADEARAVYRELRRRAAPVLVCANHLTLIDSAVIAWALGSPWWYLRHFAALPWNVPERANFAASLLMVAVIGVTIGFRYYLLALAITALTLAVLTVLRFVERFLTSRANRD